MELLEGLIKLEGKPAEIPDSSRDDIPRLFKQMGFKTGAEIGVYKGDFTKKLLSEGLKVYAIDPYGAYKGNGHKSQFQSRQDFIYGHAQRNLAEYIKSGQCELIRKKSMDALKDFKNESLDFVYIDADHRFKYIAEDLYEWIWKVKKGGIISGHDYGCTAEGREDQIIHVGCIVDAYTKAFYVKNWFLVGSKHPKKNERHDKWLSWMWVRE